jgi:hypothetical protein
MIPAPAIQGDNPTEAMAYRFHPVIPADLETGTSFPARSRHSLRDNEKDCVEGNVEKNSTYSRSTMAYTLCTLAASAAFIAAGLPFLAMGEEMAWWLFATYPVGGGILGLLVLIWRGGKDEDSRKRTGWQAVFGMVAAVGVPRFAYFLHPALGASAFLRDPITLGVIGFLCFLAASGGAPGVMKFWDKDAPKIGYRETKKAVRRHVEQPTEKLEP